MEDIRKERIILSMVTLAEVCCLYFAFGIFMEFYHVIHDTSLFEVSVAALLFMITFTILDRVAMLNIIFQKASAGIASNCGSEAAFESVLKMYYDSYDIHNIRIAGIGNAKVKCRYGKYSRNVSYGE